MLWNFRRIWEASRSIPRIYRTTGKHPARFVSTPCRRSPRPSWDAESIHLCSFVTYNKPRWRHHAHPLARSISFPMQNYLVNYIVQFFLPEIFVCWSTSSAIKFFVFGRSLLRYCTTFGMCLLSARLKYLIGFLGSNYSKKILYRCKVRLEQSNFGSNTMKTNRVLVNSSVKRKRGYITFISATYIPSVSLFTYC